MLRGFRRRSSYVNDHACAFCAFCASSLCVVRVSLQSRFLQSEVNLAEFLAELLLALRDARAPLAAPRDARAPLAAPRDARAVRFVRVFQKSKSDDVQHYLHVIRHNANNIEADGSSAADLDPRDMPDYSPRKNTRRNLGSSMTPASHQCRHTSRIGDHPPYEQAGRE